MFCNICNTFLGEPIYEAKASHALTSLCELREGRIRVWSCPACAHMCGESLPDTKSYYESDYRILLDQDDEDQIYEVHGEKIIYRTDHQVATLLNKLEIPPEAKLLDYGCAKASTPKRLLASRQDIQIHLFDVSDMYSSHWHLFVEPEQCAIHNTPAHWQDHFDIVTSFFALEHIPTPLDTVQRIAALLQDDGVFYGIVPDTFSNVADFIVIDHVNHFTAASLHTLLRAAGFADIRIDDQAHRGALVFTARKSGATTFCPDVTAIRLRSNQLAKYWTQLSDRIQDTEREHADLPIAIYGSGFYGAYIVSVLQAPERVQCFLDASPYQQGKQLFGKNIVAPQSLPESVRVLYVGLNPVIARDVISKMDWLRDRDLSVVFLDQGTP
jgi:SAM-dependent methyltransferase